MKILAMIPARLGSQRLKQKNLEQIIGISILGHAVLRAKKADCFTGIWVNTESDILGEEGLKYGAEYHKRPDNLADNNATSEDFVYEFLQKHDCDYLVQLHSIAPLLGISKIKGFVDLLKTDNYDVLLSAIYEQIECAIDSEPVNFTFKEKTNSQELRPIQRITWSITGWKKTTFMKAYEEKKCATYTGKIGFYEVDRISGHVVKTKEDLDIIRSLYPLVEKDL